MGQYYQAVTIDKDGTPTVYNLQPDKFRQTQNYDYYNGVKLMEHSWIGNSFTDFLSGLLWNNPMRVAWVGDYAYSERAENHAHERNQDFKLSHEQYKTLYELAWPDDGYDMTISFPYSQKHFIYKDTFLVNHTKKCYFSLNPFVYKRNAWKVYPISLLTAVGNGQGGGDYHKTFRNYDRVGAWALDLISIENFPAEGYNDVGDPDFDDEA